MSSVEDTHWCHRCQRVVHIVEERAKACCPCCRSGFVEELGDLHLCSQEDLSGSSACVDAIPTISISKKHILSKSQCPVCQETFQLGTEAVQLPCNHFYHPSVVPSQAQHLSSLPPRGASYYYRFSQSTQYQSRKQ